jgi:hypothetical protein
MSMKRFTRALAAWAWGMVGGCLGGGLASRRFVADCERPQRDWRERAQDGFQHCEGGFSRGRADSRSCLLHEKSAAPAAI